MRRPLALVLVLLLAPTLVHAQGADEAAAERALAWLGTLPPAQRGYATNAVEAAGLAGHDPKRWPNAEENVFAQLAPYAGVDGEYYSYLRVAHAAGASGYDPRDVNGVDYVQKVREGFTGGQSGSPTFVNDDIWAILALRAAGVPPDDEQIRASVTTLKASQLPDGSWAYRFPALKGATDVTGAALAALRAAGEDMGGFDDARSYLDSTHDAATGGHVDGQGSGANCQSTIWALHGYSALGAEERPASVAFLRRLQHAGGGLGTSLRSDGTPTNANAFCTAEAIPVLAGARAPFASYAPVHVSAIAHAREPATLSVSAPHTDLAVRWHDARVEGGRTFTAPATGTYSYDFHAQGAGVRARGTSDVSVMSARPILGEFPERVVVHRPTALGVDLANATDPDGTIASFEIDWGDGNVTNETYHLYAAPREYDVSIRALDNAGVWSHPARMSVVVPNRPPVLGPLPARIVGDRVHGATLDVRASDPDGDALVGTGPRTFMTDALGAQNATIVVRDEYGAEARADVTLEIVNLPPRVAIHPLADITADDEVELTAEASDLDGPPPTLTWSVGPRARFPAGTHTVRVVATDGDGARTTASLTFVARAPGDSPADGGPPEVRALDATLAEGLLRVTFDAVGEAIVRWESDAGSGERIGATSPLAIELPGATWASVSVDATRAGTAAWRESGIVVARDAAASEREAAVEAMPTSLVVRAAPVESEPQAESAIESTGEVTQAPAREAPAPAWWLALAATLLAATLGRRAR